MTTTMTTRTTTIKCIGLNWDSADFGRTAGAAAFTAVLVIVVVETFVKRRSVR